MCDEAVLSVHLGDVDELLLPCVGFRVHVLPPLHYLGVLQDKQQPQRFRANHLAESSCHVRGDIGTRTERGGGWRGGVLVSCMTVVV